MKNKMRNPFRVAAFFIVASAVYHFARSNSETGWFLLVLAGVLVVYDLVTEAK